MPATALNNSNKGAGLFLRVPLLFNHLLVNGKKLASSAILTLAHAFSFSDEGGEGENGKPQKSCHINYKLLGVSKSTAQRRLKDLTEGSYIEKVSRDRLGNVYVFKGEKPKGEYDVIPRFLLDLSVQDITGERKLRRSEVRVLAYIMRKAMPMETFTLLMDDNVAIITRRKIVKEKRFTYKSSIREIAEALNLGEKTVFEAKNALVAAGYLSVPVSQLGKNQNKKTRFEIGNRAVYDYLFHREEKKAPQKAKKTPQQAHFDQIAALDARAERERYFARRREANQQILDRNLKKVKNDEAYKQAVQEFAKLNPQLARAEIAGDTKEVARLEQAQANWHKQKLLVLRRYGLDEKDVTLQYTCSKCQDTGFLQSGAGCTCYKKE